VLNAATMPKLNDRTREAPGSRSGCSFGGSSCRGTFSRNVISVFCSISWRDTSKAAFFHNISAARVAIAPFTNSIATLVSPVSGSV
jgi:hypothetical protein